MKPEYFETGYIDDDPEPEELEDEMPDEPEYIAMTHANWDLLAEPKPHWGEMLMRERDNLVRAVERAGTAAGYTIPGLMYKAVEEFEFPFLQQTLIGIDSEALEKMLAALQRELADRQSRANQLALKMASANLAPLEAARKAS
jgi:hypothetical protein